MYFLAIVQHTPAWVWGLRAALVTLGLWQTRTLEASLTRVTVLPLVLTALSLGGVLSKFGHMPLALASDATFSGLSSLAYGSLSGLFLARALSLRGLATRPVTMQTA